MNTKTLLRTPPTLVLLHGWGCDSNCWQPLLEPLQTFATVITLDLPGFGNTIALEDSAFEFTRENLLNHLAAQLPDHCVLMGWSLGGMLAVQLAEKFPHKISHIITFASNLKFVASDDYPYAMPLKINQEFNDSFAQDAEKTLKLFSGLIAQGDDNERALLKKMRSLISSNALPSQEKLTDYWLQALYVLAELDNRAAFVSLAQPGLHLFAEKDALVPAAAADALRQRNATQQVAIIAGAAHALHWSQPETIIESIRQFLFNQSLDKKYIAKSFSRAAESYDSAASLQREAGYQLLQFLANEYLPSRQKTASHVTENVYCVDLGCGTGHFLPELKKLMPNTQIVGMDIAEGMLKFSVRNSNQLALCADAEVLPFASHSIDCIFSNFALQWCENLPALLSEIHRVLTPNGQFFFTTLGENTLHELKSAWRAVDEGVHVNQFIAVETVQQQLLNSGWKIEIFKTQSQTLLFDSLKALTQHLKLLGAHNNNRARPQGLTSRQRLEKFSRAMSQQCIDGKFPATYEIVYGAVIKQSPLLEKNFV